VVLFGRRKEAFQQGSFDFLRGQYMWPSYNGDYFRQRFSSLAKITRTFTISV